MKTEDRAEFLSLLNLCYSTLLRPLPPADSLKLWEGLLKPYSLEQVSAAFYRHMQVSKFAPMPADIIGFLTPSAGNDGRPEANEAWVTALAGNDERKTVRWTTETAQALSQDVKDLLEGDETAARMAFKDIYTRLCNEARAANRPVEWIVSWGYDRIQREDFARSAVESGVIQLEHVKQHVPALAAPVEKYDAEKARRNLAAIKAMIAESASARETVNAQRAREIIAERERIEFVKLETAVRVADYERSHA